LLRALVENRQSHECRMARENLVASASDTAPARGSLIYDPRVRGLFFQALLVLIVGYAIYEAASNAAANLRASGIASGFGFLNNTASFPINQTLVSYAATDTYGRAFLVGLLNTLLVAAIGIVLATILGFIVGIARLSPNWLISKIAMVYVEAIRNLPLLLQLYFWYNAVRSVLPDARNAWEFGAGIYLSNRGLTTPMPVYGEGAWLIPAALGLGILGTILFRAWAHRQQAETGRQYPVGLVALGLIVGLPLLTWIVLTAVAANPVTFEVPTKSRFNLVGGLQLFPEFVALLLGLTTYTAAFIAEVVRAGILAVSHGQTEAARSLGLSPGHTLRLVVVPQAMRVIIPPLTSQYLNLTKNSSLAVAIGYPDVVSIANTSLNQTGRAVECIAIIMAVYLTLSLTTSALMNWYNARVAIKEK
jgi:general L-amino acid transport system permease protein